MLHNFFYHCLIYGYAQISQIGVEQKVYRNCENERHLMVNLVPSVFEGWGDERPWEQD